MMHVVDQDTLITEDLIEMVSSGKIPLTIVDSDIARLNKTYYNSLDVSLEVSFPQRSSWGVPIDKAWLADSINAWIDSSEPRQAQEKLLKRYFELSKTARRCRSTCRKAECRPTTTFSRNMPKILVGTGECLPHKDMPKAGLTPRLCHGPEHADSCRSCPARHVPTDCR